MKTLLYIACLVAASVTLLAVGAMFEWLIPVVASTIPPQFKQFPALYRDWPSWSATYMVVHPLAYGVPFAMGYWHLTSGGGWRSGLKYGLLVFFLGALPVWLLMYASVRVSPEMMASFVVRSVCQYAAAGIVLGIIRRPATPSAAV